MKMETLIEWRPTTKCNIWIACFDCFMKTKTKMSREKELTQGERYVIAQTMDDFENTWNDHQEFDDMDCTKIKK